MDLQGDTKQTGFRMPVSLRDRVEREAMRNQRRLSGEMIVLIGEALQARDEAAEVFGNPWKKRKKAKKRF